MRSPSTLGGEGKVGPEDDFLFLAFRSEDSAAKVVSDPLFRPVLREYRRHLRMRFDALQRFVKPRTCLLQVHSRSRPFRHDGGVKVERADPASAEIRMRRKEVGEHFPVLMQPRARAGTDALLHRFIGILAPALGIIDDTDRRIAVCRDEREPANCLRSGRIVTGQQSAVRVREAEMDEDGRAFRKHAAVRQHERRYLPERIHLEELGVRLVLLPRSRLDEAAGRTDDRERGFDRCRPRAILAV